MEVQIFILNARIQSIDGLKTRSRTVGTLTLLANRTLLTPGIQVIGNSSRTVSPSWRRSLPAQIEPRDDFGSGLQDEGYVASVDVPGNSRVEFVYAADAGDGSHPAIQFDIRGTGDQGKNDQDTHPVIKFRAQPSTNRITARYTVTTEEGAQSSSSSPTTIAKVVVLIGEELSESENAIVRFWNQTGTKLTLMPRTVSNRANVYGTAAPEQLSPELGSVSQGQGVMLLPLPASTVLYDYVLPKINLKYAVTVSCDKSGKVDLGIDRVGDPNYTDVYTALVEVTGIYQYNSKVFDVYFIDSRSGVIEPGAESTGASSTEELLEIRKIREETEEEEEEDESPDRAEPSDVPYGVTLDIINAMPNGNLVLQKDDTIRPDGIRFNRHKPVPETIGRRASITVPRGPGGMNDLTFGQIGFTMPATGVLVLRYKVSGNNVVHGKGAVISLSTGRTSEKGKHLFTGSTSDTTAIWVRQRRAHRIATGLPQLDAVQGDGPNRFRFAICVGSTTKVSKPDVDLVPMALNFVNRTDMTLDCTRATVARGSFPGTGIPDTLDTRDKPLSLGKSICFPSRSSRLELQFSATSGDTSYSITVDVSDTGLVITKGESSASNIYQISTFTKALHGDKEITIWFAGRNEPGLPSGPGRSDGDSPDD